MPQNNAKPQPDKMPVDIKKLLTIAGVTVAVVIAAILLDNIIRNPRCKDETDAVNLMFQKVLPSVDEIADDEGGGIQVDEVEVIGDEEYYPVLLTRVPKCEDAVAAAQVVDRRVLPGMVSGGQVDLITKPEVTIGEDVYFVVEVSRTQEGTGKEEIATVYVRRKNSQPFVMEADGTLSPLAGEEELPVLTVYVCKKNSQIFVKDDTTGQLIPYGG